MQLRPHQFAPQQPGYQQHQQIAARVDQAIDKRLALPERQFATGHLTVGKRCVDHVQGIAAAAGVAHCLTHQRFDLRQLLFAHRLWFAVFIGAQIVDHHGDRQTLQGAGFLLGMTDGAVEFVVGGRVATGILRYAAGRRAAGGCGVLRGGVGIVACRGGWLGSLNRRRGRRAWLIGQCARHAAYLWPADLLAQAGLLRADSGFVRLLVRLVLFIGLFASGEVDLRRDLRAHVGAADHRGEDRFDAALEAVFHFVGVFQLRGVEIAPGAVGLRQQTAGLIDHGHVARRQAGDAARHHINDGVDLAIVQRTAGLQGQRYRRGRGFLFAHEQRRFRQRQVNAGVLHRPQRFDSARQLALEGALIVDLLAELADAEFFLIQQFEADGAAFRQPLLRQAQAGFMHLFRRDQQCCAILGKAVRDIHLRQLGDDGATVAVVQIAV